MQRIKKTKNRRLKSYKRGLYSRSIRKCFSSSSWNSSITRNTSERRRNVALERKRLLGKNKRLKGKCSWSKRGLDTKRRRKGGFWRWSFCTKRDSNMSSIWESKSYYSRGNNFFSCLGIKNTSGCNNSRWSSYYRRNNNSNLKRLSKSHQYWNSHAIIIYRWLSKISRIRILTTSRCMQMATWTMLFWAILATTILCSKWLSLNNTGYLPMIWSKQLSRSSLLLRSLHTKIRIKTTKPVASKICSGGAWTEVSYLTTLTMNSSTTRRMKTGWWSQSRARENFKALIVMLNNNIQRMKERNIQCQKNIIRPMPMRIPYSIIRNTRP